MINLFHTVSLLRGEYVLCTSSESLGSNLVSMVTTNLGVHYKKINFCYLLGTKDFPTVSAVMLSLCEGELNPTVLTVVDSTVQHPVLHNTTYKIQLPMILQGHPHYTKIIKSI